MSLIKRLFFAVFACVVMCGVATAADCPAGKYRYGSVCYDCKDGCYCKGGENQIAGILSCNAKDQVLKFGALKKDNGFRGVYLCPADFPNSPSGATSIDQCYVQCNRAGMKKMFQYKKIHCASGSALHYLSSECTSCKGNVTWVGMNSVCPGGDFFPSCGNIQGTQKCENGTVPNAERTACVAQKVSCSAGTYLPKGNTQCVSCPRTNVYCPGIKDISVDNTKDQGVSNCPSGSTPADDRKSCNEIPKISCSAGTYLKKGESTCSDCTKVPRSPQENWHCPGVTAQVDTTKDQGKVNCPSGQKASQDMKICEKIIHCNLGEYLPAGKEECVKPCKPGQLCGGGDFTKRDYDQFGPRVCANTNEVPNEDGTACVKKAPEKQYAACFIGEYLPSNATTCTKCDDGYACPGGKFEVKAEEQGRTKCKSGEKSNKDRTACISAEVKCSSGEYVSSQTCKKCPERYTKSDDGATADSQCYTLASDGKTKLYNKLIVVPAGQYLPKESMSPAKCPSGKVCKGSAGHGAKDGWGPRFGEYGDIGAYACTNAGEVPNSEQTACVKKKEEPKKEEKKKEEPKNVNCDPGYYLPSNSSTCATCLDGSACKGGSFMVKSGDQGIVKCDASTEVVSEDKTKCIVTLAKCKKGFYLKAKEQACRVCDGVNNYCPGGNFDIADVDQGIYECPSNSSVNSAKSGCRMTFSKDVMYYGPGYRTSNYRHQCWFMVSNEDYKNCVIKNQE